MFSLPTLVLVFAAVFLADHLLERAFAGDYQAIAIIDGMLACGVCVALIRLLGRHEETPVILLEESPDAAPEEPVQRPTRLPMHVLPCKRFNRGRCFARFNSCKYSHHCSTCEDLSAHHSAAGEDCPGAVKVPATRGSRRRGKKHAASKPTAAESENLDPEAKRAGDNRLEQLGRLAA
mmetsp:Transcript_21462/g.47109  ORF Transcript_21462/g.47109 Transcript_21462/m.47109 type:complete len:178 (-) Transcript_21462:109-642(-)